MKYIADTFGCKINIDPWQESVKLPFYLLERYDFNVVTLDSMICLFMKLRIKDDTVSMIKKHIASVEKIAQIPIVIEFTDMTAAKRNALIKARIPFVVDGKQIYLPFLGAYLQEKYAVNGRINKKLMPASQVLLLYYLYQNKDDLYINDVTQKLGFSAMQITRAVKQLKELELIKTQKDGVRIIIKGTEKRSLLFEKANPHLINPVRKKKYVKEADMPGGLPLSGLSALSELSMLNPPEVRTFAFDGDQDSIFGIETLYDNETQVEIELWRYSPSLFSTRHDTVDPLSLAASLKENTDERVEEAIEKIISEIWR